jgi:hypothetical protein
MSFGFLFLPYSLLAIRYSHLNFQQSSRAAIFPPCFPFTRAPPSQGLVFGLPNLTGAVRDAWPCSAERRTDQ